MILIYVLTLIVAVIVAVVHCLIAVREIKRLNYMIDSGAFLNIIELDSGDFYQLMCTDDTTYEITLLSGDKLYESPRDAIDAAMRSKRK